MKIEIEIDVMCLIQIVSSYAWPWEEQEPHGTRHSHAGKLSFNKQNKIFRILIIMF